MIKYETTTKDNKCIFCEISAGGGSMADPKGLKKLASEISKSQK